MAKRSRKSKWPHAKHVRMSLHPNGQWVKRVRGKLRYFGTDADQALQLWREIGDDLEAGREPKAHSSDTSLERLVNKWLADFREQVEHGERSASTYRDYLQTGKKILAILPRAKRAEELRPEDFRKLKRGFSGGPVATKNAMVHTRRCFTWAKANRLIRELPAYGTMFDLPTAREIRKARQGSEADQGKKLFAADEIRKMLEAADPQMNALILLGINCALGNGDLGELQTRHVDLKKRMLTYPRPKTGEERECPLWPETIKALSSVWPEAEGPVFRTERGLPLVRMKEGGEAGVVGSDRITEPFARLRKDLGIFRSGVGFYCLRRTFRTVSDELGDIHAVCRIMGHRLTGPMATHYVRSIDPKRLKAVTNHVRKWLWPKSR